MKLTKSKLKEIIREEILKLNEANYKLYHKTFSDAADEVLKMGCEGDTQAMIERCDELDPYFKATRSLALAVHVFATEASETFTTADETNEE